ncbi:MAG: MerR family transcriptional regulator [Thermoanaerobaculia bacterium]|nr:MerR family transcriptional regulator [Thermoanaerobaculia bacterium]MCZ7650852.1 MerR family transcriptional regulator [Thermoanaerobaculia bacterium]
MAKKTGYRIGDLCRLLDLQPYVLRYWETEFPALQAPEGASGQRLYTEEELEIVRRIKRLLYDEGFTIAGAKKRLDAELAAGGGVLGAATLFAEESPAAEAPPPPRLDSDSSQRIERVGAALAEILAEARALQRMVREEESGPYLED